MPVQLLGNHHMQYGICNETFGNWPLKRVCEFSADAGYTGIEIAPFTLGENPHELSSNQRGDLRRIIAQAGLECIGSALASRKD